MRLGLGGDFEKSVSRLELIPGWISETMPHFKIRAARDRIKISFVHADCDIYEPFLATLVNTWDALSVGGVVSLGFLDNPELAGKAIAVEEFTGNLPAGSWELGSFPIVDNGLNRREESFLRKLG